MARNLKMASEAAIIIALPAFGSVWERPAPLRGAHIAFKFQNPLVQAEAEAKTVALTSVVQLLNALAPIDPGVGANVDLQTAFRSGFSGTGAPATWLRPKRAADAIVAQANAQQAAAQKAAAVGHIGEQAGKVAATAKSVGDAATSLQNAGLA